MRNGMAWLLALGMIFPVALAHAGRPEIRLVRGTHELILPRAMSNALRAYDAHIVPWRAQDYLPSILRQYRFTARQAPFAVIGDFNADGKADAMLDGHNRRHDLTLCIMSKRRGYTVLPLNISELTDLRKELYDMGDHNEYGRWTYLALRRPGIINSPHEPKPLRLTTDAVESFAYEKAAAVYYYRNGRFHEYATED